MSRFLQLHLLTSYPPSNLNRDDLGQPKTALMGGINRLRISSQSLKRAWRTSDVFQEELGAHVGTRTKRLGLDAEKTFLASGIGAKDAREWAKLIAGVYGALKSDSVEIEQLVHVSPEELTTLNSLVIKVAQDKRKPDEAELNSLLHDQNAVDIAMFGRMLASKTKFNGEAAVQVAHAIGVHASPLEDDYFTAVDDLNSDTSGAAHVGEFSFASAVFYQYICIDREQLIKNLHGDEVLAARAIRAFTEAALKVAPTGKQNSFASRAYAHFALAEKGPQQPRSLSLAFLRPVEGSDYAETAVNALLQTRKNMDQVYGACADTYAHFNVLTGEGTSAQVLDFVAAEA
jgi:CRISPR system Cascade subunit CasC